jgi:histidinol dehydrogenase
MKRVNWSSLKDTERSALLERPTQLRNDLAPQVADIIQAVRERGDEALRDFAQKFDGVKLSVFRVSEAEFAEAEKLVSDDVKQAIANAILNLRTWHKAGMPSGFQIETQPGVICGAVYRGIRSVGLYVPAGSAPLPSTAMMLGVPAMLADCREVTLCTPPNAEGKANPAVLVAAARCGILDVFKLGGAQAIAAMAIGTKSIPRCDKLFGPGNAYVTEAKQQVASMIGGPAIDMPAGPSEVLVIADAGANPSFVAADLLSQAEHGPDSQVILISDSDELIDKVQVQLSVQLKQLERANITERALQHARLIRVNNVFEAIDISNRYAPEHLILAVRDADALLPRVEAAGSVFLGDYAAESFGDYCSGTNHVLPTYGAARAYSGVSIVSFQTRISIQRLNEKGVRNLAHTAITLANAEGLDAHAKAAQLRVESLA